MKKGTVLLLFALLLAVGVKGQLGLAIIGIAFVYGMFGEITKKILFRKMRY